MGNWSKCKVEVEDVSGFMCVAVNQWPGLMRCYTPGTWSSGIKEREKKKKNWLFWCTLESGKFQKFTICWKTEWPSVAPQSLSSGSFAKMWYPVGKTKFPRWWEQLLKLLPPHPHTQTALYSASWKYNGCKMMACRKSVCVTHWGRLNVQTWEFFFFVFFKHF